MFKYNFNQDERDALLKITKYDDCNKSFASFKNLNVRTLKILLDKNFANPSMRQQRAPSIRKFYEFMLVHPEYKAHGYMCGLARQDYRISIEGLKGRPKNLVSRFDFYNMFRKADEFSDNADGLRCWYD